MTRNAILKRLRAGIVAAGSLRKHARELGISPAHLSDVMLGRREPGLKVLGPLGLSKTVTVRRNVTYRRAKE